MQELFNLEQIGRLVQENPKFVQLLKSLVGDNYGSILNGQVVTVADTGTINTEFAVAHGLLDSNGDARLPNGYIVVKKDKAADVYAGGTADTTTNLYLKCDVANAAISIWVF